MPWTVSAWGGPVSLVCSSAPWGAPGMPSGALSRHWLEEGEPRPRLLAGHLTPRRMGPMPSLLWASSAARLPVPLAVPDSGLLPARGGPCPACCQPAPCPGLLQGRASAHPACPRPRIAQPSPAPSTVGDALALVQPTDCTHSAVTPSQASPGSPGGPHLPWHSHDNGLALALMQFVEPGKGRGRRSRGCSSAHTSSPGLLYPQLPHPSPS